MEEPWQGGILTEEGQLVSQGGGSQPHSPPRPSHLWCTVEILPSQSARVRLEDLLRLEEKLWPWSARL